MYARARRTTAPAAIVAPSASSHAGHAPASTRSPRTRPRRCSPVNLRASAATSLRGSIAWSPSMSSARRIVGAKRRLEATRLGGAEPLDRQAELAPERRQAVERLGLVAVARDDHRAGRAVAGVVELGAEVRVAARALHAQREQLALAELGLGHRREHPRGDVPRAGLAGVDDDRLAPRAVAPATRTRGRSRHRRRRRRRSSRTVLALRLRPPYAGTTRIRFDGRRPDGALSARLRAPVFWRSWYPLMGDATRAPRRRPPLPRLPRASAGLDRGRGARRGRPDPAARQDALGRRVGGGRARLRRPRRALHPQRPAGPGRRVRRRRHPRRPGRRPAEGRTGRGRAGPHRRPLDPRARPGRGGGGRRGRRLPRGRTGPRDADQAGPPGRGPGVRRARGGAP